MNQGATPKPGAGVPGLPQLSNPQASSGSQPPPLLRRPAPPQAGPQAGPQAAPQTGVPPLLRRPAAQANPQSPTPNPTAPNSGSFGGLGAATGAAPVAGHAAQRQQTNLAGMAGGAGAAGGMAAGGGQTPPTAGEAPAGDAAGGDSPAAGHPFDSFLQPLGLGGMPSWGKWLAGIGGPMVLLLLLSRLFGKQAAYSPQQVKQAQDYLRQKLAAAGCKVAPRYSRQAKHTKPDGKFAPGHTYQGSLIKKAIDVETGGLPSRLTASTLGRVLGVGGLLETGRAWHNPHRPSRRGKHEEIARLMAQAEPEALATTKLRLGGTDFLDDMVWKRERGEDLPWHKQIGGRLWQNPRTGIISKLLGTAITPGVNIANSIKRRPHYNPYTDVAVQFYDEPALTEHELGHAIDFNKLTTTGEPPKGFLRRQGHGLVRDIYSGAAAAPLFGLVPEMRANVTSEQAMREALKDPEKLKARDIRRTQVLPATVGRHVGDAIGLTPDSPLSLPGAALGKIYGMLSARNKRKQYDREQKATRDGDGDGKVNDNTPREKAAALIQNLTNPKMVRTSSRQLLGIPIPNSPSVRASDTRTASTTSMARAKDRQGNFVVT